MTPTQRTLAALRADGYTAEVVERWNPYARGFDMTCSASWTFWRFAQAKRWPCRRPPVVEYPRASRKSPHRLRCHCYTLGWRVQVHGWRRVKLKRGGRATRWDCRIVEMGASDSYPGDL